MGLISEMSTSERTVLGYYYVHRSYFALSTLYTDRRSPRPAETYIVFYSPDAVNSLSVALSTSLYHAVDHLGSSGPCYSTKPRRRKMTAPRIQDFRGGPDISPQLLTIDIDALNNPGDCLLPAYRPRSAVKTCPEYETVRH